MCLFSHKQIHLFLLRNEDDINLRSCVEHRLEKTGKSYDFLNIYKCKLEIYEDVATWCKLNKKIVFY